MYGCLMTATSSARARRTCLTVPGSSNKMLRRAASLSADEIILDLEDSVTPSAKTNETRAAVADALLASEWVSPTRSVRVNAVQTPWCHRDIVFLTEHAGSAIDCIVVPKVEQSSHIHFVSHLLDQLERERGLEKTIKIEVQIESPRALLAVDQIARSSTRIEALIFGPGDYAAAVGAPQLPIGATDERYPGHQWHYPLSILVAAARTHGLQAIDGPFALINDLDGFKASAHAARVLGLDGKWVIHPSQIEHCNDVFSPSQAELEQAENVLALYQETAAQAGPGAVLLDGEMIDEATRRLALAVRERAKAAGMLDG
jgi:citrate lyase subunit beta / citryl-CoA lyase